MSAACIGGRDSCPNCQVCGGEASGFHYGVDSCEGCKGFFRRCITQGMTNRCANDEKCEITPFSRNSCQFCRLKKCFSVGMSREGSRLGRRPKRLKICNNLQAKSCHKASDVHASSAAASQVKVFGQMKAERNSMIRRSNSSDLEKFGSSVSVEEDLKPGRSDYFSCVTSHVNDGCYHDALGYPEQQQDNLMSAIHHSKLRPSASILSAARNSEAFIQGANCLPRRITIGNNCESFVEKAGCLQPASKLAMATCNTQIYDASLPCDGNSGWSGCMDTPSEIGSVSRLVKGKHKVCVCVPETMTLSGQSNFIKREVMMEKSVLSDDETAILERDFKTHPYAYFYDVQGSSVNHNFRVKTENEGSFMNSLGDKYFDQCVKEERWDSNRNRTLGGLWKLEMPEACGMFRPVSDKDTLPCTSSEAEEFGSYQSSLSSDILIRESMKPPDHDKMGLINHVIKTVVEAHLNTCNYTSQKVADGMQVYKEMTFSGQATVNRKDLDPSKIWTKFIDNMAPVIKRVVKFSKKIPGFSELHQDDQIGLIKQGSFEVILTRYTQLFTKDGMFVPDMTILVPRSFIHWMPMGTFFEEQYQFAEMFNGMKLNDAEVGLLTASMIVCPDRLGLMNSNAIHQLHLLLLQSLYIYMKQSHPGECDNLFSKTIHILPFIRKINDSHAKQLNNIKMSTAEIFFPALHDEVFDSAG